MPIERIEARMAPQQGAAGGDECAKLGGSIGVVRQLPLAKIAVQQFEYFELEIRDAPIIDQVCGAQLGDSRLHGRLGHAALRGRALRVVRNRGHGDVQHVQKIPIRCAIRARALRIGRGERVQRIQTDETRAAGCQPADHRLQVVEIADSPIGRGAQRVELYRDAPNAPAVDDRRRLVAKVRRHDDQTAVRRAARDPRLQFVIARRQLARQFETPARNPGTGDFAAPQFGAVGRRRRSLVPAAVLEFDCPQKRGAEFERRDVDVETDPRALRRDHGRQQTARLRDLDARDFRAQRCVIVDPHAHRAQDLGARCDREMSHLAAVIVIDRAHAAQIGQPLDQGAFHRLSTPTARRCALAADNARRRWANRRRTAPARYRLSRTTRPPAADSAV